MSEETSERGLVAAGSDRTEELRALMREAVELEKEFIRDCLPVNSIGLLTHSKS